MIDLGTRPLGHELPFAVLDDDRMDFLVEELRIAELPVVLDVRPRFDAVSTRDAASKLGRAGLSADGLLPDGRVHPDVEMWLQVLERPDWFVAARLVPRPLDGHTHVTRVCLASNESGTVVAVRTGNRIMVRATAADPADDILGALGSGTPFEFRSVSAPTDDLAEALDASPTDSVATTDQLVYLGIDPADAADVASAMTVCSMHAEITLVTIDSGTRSVGRHPVSFFDTHRGRLVATASTAADGRQWTTLSPGSDGRIRGALAELVQRGRVS